MPLDYLRDCNGKEATIVITVILALSETLAGGVEELYILPNDECGTSTCRTIATVSTPRCLLRVPWTTLIDPRRVLQVPLDYANLLVISNSLQLEAL